MELQLGVCRNFWSIWNLYKPRSPVGPYGYQTDGDTNLKLLGHRYYDPTIGRFLTRDPVKSGRNWYSYCDNNPVASGDPNGLQALPSWQNAIVGFGDGCSFGFSDVVRDWIGCNDVVDKEGSEYVISRLGGEVVGGYVTGGAVGRIGKLLNKGKPWKIKIGGSGSNKDHVLRIESGRVHLFPGEKWSVIDDVAHFHINKFGLNKVHLPYEIWPKIQAGRVFAHGVSIHPLPDFAQDMFDSFEENVRLGRSTAEIFERFP